MNVGGDFLGLQMSDVRAACPACGNDTSLFLAKPETGEGTQHAAAAAPQMTSLICNQLN